LYKLLAASMRKLLFVLIVIALPAAILAQADSAIATIDTLPQKIYKSKALKKGFYRNQEEFFNNAPSVTRDFTVKEKTTIEKRKAGGISAVVYVLADGEAAVEGEIWGFCDGKDVFVKSHVGYGYSWKLDCIGQHPYYIFPLQRGVVDIITGASYEIILMNKKGKFKRVHSAGIIELFESEPDIQYDFKKALGPDIYEPNPNRSAITRKYLKLFNERLIEQEQ